MSKFQRKLLIWLLMLCVLTPIGIYLPELFSAGDAWGEWDVKTVEEKAGFVPKGMAKDAALWNAPVADYKMEEDSCLLKQSFDYIVSAALGLFFTILVTWGLIKIFGRNEQAS